MTRLTVASVVSQVNDLTQGIIQGIIADCENGSSWMNEEAAVRWRGDNKHTSKAIDALVFYVRQLEKKLETAAAEKLAKTPIEFPIEVGCKTCSRADDNGVSLCMGCIGWNPKSKLVPQNSWVGIGPRVYYLKEAK